MIMVLGHSFFCRAFQSSPVLRRGEHWYIGQAMQQSPPANHHFNGQLLYKKVNMIKNVHKEFHPSSSSAPKEALTMLNEFLGQRFQYSTIQIVTACLTQYVKQCGLAVAITHNMLFYLYRVSGVMACIQNIALCVLTAERIYFVIWQS